MLKLNCWHANGNTDYFLLISGEVVMVIMSLLRRAVRSNAVAQCHFTATPGTLAKLLIGSECSTRS